jgi:hypothetical protein
VPAASRQYFKEKPPPARPRARVSRIRLMHANVLTLMPEVEICAGFAHRAR